MSNVMPVTVGANELVLLDELLDVELLTLLEELLEIDEMLELTLLDELLTLLLDVTELEADAVLELLSLHPAIMPITIAPRNNDLISLFMLFPFVEINICINTICL